MKQKLKLPEIVVPPSGKKRWLGGAYTFAFVYSPKGNFLIKGYLKEVEEYITKNIGGRYLIRLVLYGAPKYNNYRDNRPFRKILHFSDVCNLFIDSPNLRRHNYRTKYHIYPKTYFSNPNASIFKLKRLPQRWIPEYDYLIDTFGQKDI